MFKYVLLCIWNGLPVCVGVFSHAKLKYQRKRPTTSPLLIQSVYLCKWTHNNDTQKIHWLLLSQNSWRERKSKTIVDCYNKCVIELSIQRYFRNFDNSSMKSGCIIWFLHLSTGHEFEIHNISEQKVMCSSIQQWLKFLWLYLNDWFQLHLVQQCIWINVCILNCLLSFLWDSEKIV